MGTKNKDNMKIAAIFVATAQALSIENMMQMTKDMIAEYAPTPGNGSFIKCSKQFEQDANKCAEDAAAAPECQENGPDFDPIKCNQDFIGCFFRSFANFSKCLEGNIE